MFGAARFEKTYYDPLQIVEPRADPAHADYDPFHVSIPKLRSAIALFASSRCPLTSHLFAKEIFFAHCRPD